MTSMEDWDNTEDGSELDHANFWTYDGSNNSDIICTVYAYNSNLSSYSQTHSVYL